MRELNRFKQLLKLRRPPQSWCYVDGKKERRMSTEHETIETDTEPPLKLDREYIVRETAFLLATEQEIEQELVRCKGCLWFEPPRVCLRHGRFVENSKWFCADGERREG